MIRFLFKLVAICAALLVVVSLLLGAIVCVFLPVGVYDHRVSPATVVVGKSNISVLRPPEGKVLVVGQDPFRGAGLPGFQDYSMLGGIARTAGLPLALLFALLLICFVATFVALVLRRPNKRGAQTGMDDERMIQEIYRNLTRMEQRIESLETLLLEGGSR